MVVGVVLSQDVIRRVRPRPAQSPLGPAGGVGGGNRIRLVRPPPALLPNPLSPLPPPRQVLRPAGPPPTQAALPPPPPPPVAQQPRPTPLPIAPVSFR